MWIFGENPSGNATYWAREMPVSCARGILASAETLRKGLLSPKQALMSGSVC